MLIVPFVRILELRRRRKILKMKLKIYMCVYGKATTHTYRDTMAICVYFKPHQCVDVTNVIMF